MLQLLAFDLDGTLVRTEALKAISYGWAAHELRPDLDPSAVEDAYGPLVGNSRETIARTLLDQFDLADAALARDPSAEPWRTYVGVRLERYRAILADGDRMRANTWPRTVAVLREAREVARHVALVTTSERWAADAILGALGLADAFDAIVTADDVEVVKPDPAGYRLALDRLSVRSENALALEDSPSGVRAAQAAGMDALAIPTRYTREPLGAMVREGELDARSVVVPGALAEAIRTRAKRAAV